MVSVFSISHLLLLLLLFFSATCFFSTDASVHEYSTARFTSKGNAFVLHGGSEGLYASLPNSNSSSVAANGESYIRIAQLKDEKLSNNGRPNQLQTIDKRDTSTLNLIYQAQKAERDATDLKGSMRKRMEFLDLD